MESLWGEFSIEKIETPKSILEAQASILPKITKRKVYASIEIIRDGVMESLPDLKRDFNYGFYIKSDFLNNYSYGLFTVHHGIEIYPLLIDIPKSLKEEVDAKVALDGIEFRVDRMNTLVIKNMNEFKNAIGIILQSQQVRSVISSLVSLASDDEFKVF